MAEAIVLVGLGNPGQRYRETYHNIGFLLADYIAHHFELEPIPLRLGCEGYRGKIADREVFVLKPQTFMNKSGETLASWLRYYKIPPANIIVMHDELEKPFAAISVKQNGGAAGHNGIRSITAELGTNEYRRLRLGIGRPTHLDVSGYVLSAMKSAELEQLSDIFSMICNNLILVIERKEAEFLAKATLVTK